MADKKFFNLTDITKRVQHYLQPAVGKSFWLKAEISSGRERGGSFYCNLVETDSNGKILAKLSCTIWSRDLSRIRNKFQDQNLSLKLDDGTSVGFQCAIQYNPQYGLSLKVEDADPAFALGELELKKREILDQLAKEGLFEKNRGRRVPMLPQKIGLITSQGSAAYNDFVKTLQSSKFGFEIIVADSNMQGPQTETSVLQALSVLEKLNIDLVVIIRGGGSKTDLFSLDNENIARAIASHKMPVWTGIGHEIDTSVLDYVGNRSFKTPTAVSEELVARFIEMDRHLNESRNRLKSTWDYRFEGERAWVSESKTGIREGTRKLIDILKSDLKSKANQLAVKVNTRLATEKGMVSVSKSRIVSLPENRIKEYRRDIGYFKYRFSKDKILVQLKNERAALRIKKSTLKAYDPKTSLERGFSLIYNKAGKLLKSVSEISQNETIITQLGDGRLTSIIETIEVKTNERN